LPDIEGDKPKRQKFKRYPIGFFHIDIAEVQTAEGMPASIDGSSSDAPEPARQLGRRLLTFQGFQCDLRLELGRVLLAVRHL
jgi:hypothetical protein